MILARVRKPFLSKGQLVKAGAFIRVAHTHLQALGDHVEAIIDQSANLSHASLTSCVGQTIAEIDRAGRPWSGFHSSLSPGERQRLRELEGRIDEAILALDLGTLMQALNEYRDQMADLRMRLH